MAETLNETIAGTTSESKTAPGLESELDAALSSLNPNKQQAPIEQEISQPIEKQEPTREIAKKDGEQKSKPIEETKEVLQDASEVSEKPSDKQEGWNSLRNNYKKAKGLVQERDEKIKKLESALADKGTTSTKEVEALKAKINELSKYQATADLQTDPEFVTKFDAPIQERVDSLKSILKDWNISEDVISKIDFSNKNTLGSIAKAIRANQDNITNEFSIEEFMTNARDVIDLHKKKNAALDEHGKNYKQVLEEKKNQSFAKSAEDEGRSRNHLKEIAATKDSAGNPAFPFLNKITAKENATPTEVAEADGHNKFVDGIYEKIESELKVNDPERKAKLVVAAAASHYLSAQLKVVTAKLKSVEDELQKVSVVSGETEKSKLKSVQRNGSGEKDLSLESALNNFRSEITAR